MMMSVCRFKAKELASHCSRSVARYPASRCRSMSSSISRPTSFSPSSSSSSWHRQLDLTRSRHESSTSTALSLFHRARRRFSTAQRLRHGHIDPPAPGEELRVTFVDQEGQRHDFEVPAGANLLDIAQHHDLEMEGACGGSCACSTCHVIVEDQDMYDRIPEPEDDENDMLDLAFGLTETSRLGCQVKMTRELDGLVAKLPSMTRNLQKSDFEAKRKKDEG